MENLPATSSSSPNYSPATETALDRIRDSYLKEGAEERLSADEKQRKEQMEAAHGLLTQYHSLEQAVPLLVGRFGISRATAYRRVTDAIRLFGDVTRSYKDGVRHILYEFAMKVFQLAASAKPPDLKQMNAAIKNMAMLKGLDKEDSNALTPDLLGSKTYVLQVNVQGRDGAAKTVSLDALDRVDGATYAELAQAVEQTDLSLEGMEKLLTERRAMGQEEEDDDEST